MAEYAIDVAAVKVDLSGTTDPVAQSVVALDVLHARQDAPYEHASSSILFADAAGFPYLHASDMPAGSTWLVYYQANIGSANNAAGSGMVRAGVVRTNAARSGGVDYALGWYKCTGHGTPSMMNGGQIVGMMEYTSNGTHDLEWWVTSTAASTVQIGGMQTIAIRTDGDNVLTKSQAGGDYWHTAQPASPSTGHSATTWTNAFSTTYTPPISGDFWLFVDSEIYGMTLNGIASVRVMVDDVQLLGQWTRKCREPREVASFAQGWRIPLSGGVEHTITMQTIVVSGATAVFHKNSHITLLNLDVFGSNVFSYEYLPSSVTATYPAWDPVVEIANYTPATSGENVLAIGSAMMFRDAGAASLLRIVNQNTGASLNDFGANSEYFGGSPDDGVVFSGGTELISAVNTYRLYASGEVGYEASPPQGYPSWPASLFILSLSRVVGPTSVKASGYEYLDTGLFIEEPGGDLQSNASGKEDQYMTELGRLTYTPPSGIIPAHPRLWITPERRAYWARYNDSGAVQADYQNMQADNHWGDYGWNYALRWLATGNSADKALAIADIQGRYDNGGPMLNSYASSQYSWQGLRDAMRNWTFCYDWLYNEPEFTPQLKKFLEDLMCAAVYMLYHADRDATALTIYNNGGTNPSTGVAGYRTNPNQNFCSTYHYVAMMAGLALGTTPATFNWPPVTGQAINFGVQYDYSGGITLPDGSNPTYTDILTWCRDRITNWLFPAWETEWAGGWNESNAYGLGVCRHQIDVLASVKHWNTEFLGYNFLRETTKYYTHSFVPRRELVAVPRGDNGGDDGRWPQDENYFRHLYLVDSYLHDNPYSRYWCESGPLQQMNNADDGYGDIPYDFLVGKRGVAGENHKNSFPTSYLTPGGDRLLVSRSSWGDTATHISMCAGIYKQNHDHSDKGSVNIWKSIAYSGDQSGGFNVCDEMYFGPNDGIRPYSQSHNNWTLFEYATLSDNSIEMPSDGWTMLFDTVNGRTTDIIRDYANSLYTYGLADLGACFATTKSDSRSATVRTPINDICQREFLHIKNGSYLILFDRMRVRTQFALAGTDFQARFHFSSQPVLTNGTYRQDNPHGGRVYQKVFNADAINFETRALTLPCVRQKISHFMPGASNWDFIVFEIPDNPAKSSMTLTEQNPTFPGLVPGSMMSVTIKETNYIHAVFSSEEDGSTPAIISYYVPKQNSGDEHYVANLVPDQAYFITETDLAPTAPGYFRYTFATTLDSVFLANSGGIVKFSPSQIATQTDTPIRASDKTMSFVESAFVQEGTLASGSELSIGFLELGGTAYDGGGFEVVATGKDDTVGFSETGDFLGDVFSDEVIGMTSRGRLLYTPPDPPRPTYNEKKIFRGNVAFYPNEELGSVFFANEPAFDSYTDILADEDDNTFVRTYRTNDPPAKGTNKVQLSNISFGLDDPAGFNGRITAIRFVMRVRTANAAGSSNPIIACDLFSGQGQVVATYSIPLDDVFSEVAEWSSPSLPVSITTDEMRDCWVRLRPRATTYSPNYYVEISSAWVETIGNLNEKVIQ